MWQKYIEEVFEPTPTDCGERTPVSVDLHSSMCPSSLPINWGKSLYSAHNRRNFAGQVLGINLSDPTVSSLLLQLIYL